MIAIAKLTQLTELRLNNFEINFDQLEEDFLSPFSTLRTLKLISFELIGSDSPGPTFCRIFSRLCPNLEELELDCHKPSYYEEPCDIEPNLGQFANLGKYIIEYYTFN